MTQQRTYRPAVGCSFGEYGRLLQAVRELNAKLFGTRDKPPPDNENARNGGAWGRSLLISSEGELHKTCVSLEMRRNSPTDEEFVEIVRYYRVRLWRGSEVGTRTADYRQSQASPSVSMLT